MQEKSFKNKLYEIIFEADTKAGWWFDVILLILIVVSVIVTMLESVTEFELNYGQYFRIIEWGLTIIFTVEYLLRLYSVRKKMNFVFSFYGIIDLLAIAPAYLSLVIAGTHFLAIIRVLRLLRVFRVLKLAQFLNEVQTYLDAFKSSINRLLVFLFAVLTLVVILGSIMYVVEGGENGFTSIPKSVYWAIVTLTTVGYGDIAPVTVIGQFLAGVVMILGYSIIIVTSGIITSEIIKKPKESLTTETCPNCFREGHDKDAIHCKYCSTKLNN